jgi:hypothetical protein
MNGNEHHRDREVCSDSTQQIQQAIDPRQATVTLVCNAQARDCFMAVVVLRLVTAAVVVAASIQ